MSTPVQLTGLEGQCALDATIAAAGETQFVVAPALTDGPNGAKTLPGCGGVFYIVNQGANPAMVDRVSTANGTTGTLLAAGASMRCDLTFSESFWVGSALGTSVAFLVG